jgi:hypothetical protein
MMKCIGREYDIESRKIGGSAFQVAVGHTLRCSADSLPLLYQIRIRPTPCRSAARSVT